MKELTRMYFLSSNGTLNNYPIRLVSETLTEKEAQYFAEGLKENLKAKAVVRHAYSENEYIVFAEFKGGVLGYYNEKMRQFEFSERFYVEPKYEGGVGMKKKITWIIGLVIFLVPLAVLWNTITGAHETVLQVLGIIGLVVLGSFILGMCIMLTVPADPNYQPPEKSPKKEKGGSVDAGKVVGTTAKIAFFPAYMIYAFGAAHRRRKKRKSDEFWRGFRPWY